MQLRMCPRPKRVVWGRLWSSRTQQAMTKEEGHGTFLDEYASWGIDYPFNDEDITDPVTTMTVAWVRHRSVPNCVGA